MESETQKWEQLSSFSSSICRWRHFVPNSALNDQGGKQKCTICSLIILQLFKAMKPKSGKVSFLDIIRETKGKKWTSIYCKTEILKNASTAISFEYLKKFVRW